jgi:mono/diheme cytochrome c family protein
MDICSDAGTVRQIVFFGWLLAFAGLVAAQDTDSLNFSPEQINKGSKIFGQNCEPCHGPRMADPQGAFDLRTFPSNQHSRFVNSVTKGKNSMPPWGDLFEPADIEALWAYVVAGEKGR